MLGSIREGKSFVSNFSSERSSLKFCNHESTAKHIQSRKRVIRKWFILLASSLSEACAKNHHKRPEYKTPNTTRKRECRMCDLFFFLTCPKTLNAFFYLFAFRERNFLAQKTTRKEGFVWSSGQNVIFTTTTTQLNHRRKYDLYSFRRFNESMRSVVLVLVVV